MCATTSVIFHPSLICCALFVWDVETVTVTVAVTMEMMKPETVNQFVFILVYICCRDVLFQMHFPKIINTSPNALLKIDVKSDRSEPVIDVTFGL